LPSKGYLRGIAYKAGIGLSTNEPKGGSANSLAGWSGYSGCLVRNSRMNKHNPKNTVAKAD